MEWEGDNSCPAQLRATNPSSEAIWNVPISVTNELGSLVSKVHVPVIPGKRAVEVSINCGSEWNTRFETRSFPQGSYLLDALPTLIRQKEDAFLVGSAFTEEQSTTARAASAIRLLEDYPQLLDRLIAELLKSRDGKQIVVDELERRPPALDGLRPATAATALAVLGQSADGRHAALEYIQKTDNVAQLAEVLKGPSPDWAAPVDLATSLLTAAEGQALPTKVEALSGVLGAAEAQSDSAVRSLVELAVDGKIATVGMRHALGDWLQTIPEARRWLKDRISKGSEVLRPDSVDIDAEVSCASAVDFLALNHDGLHDCEASAQSLKACGQFLVSHFKQASARLQPEFQERLRKAIGDLEAADVAQFAPLYAPYGLDVSAAAGVLCGRAIPAMDEQPSVARDLVLTAMALGGDGVCSGALIWHRAKRLGVSGGFLLALAGAALLPTLLTYRVLRRRWVAVKQKLLTLPRSSTLPAGGLREVLSEATWQGQLRGALSSLREELTGGSDKGAVAAARALAGLGEEGLRQLLSAARSMMIDAIESGEMQSFVLETPSGSTYFVVFPTAEDDARSLARHDSLTSGWQDHVARIRALLAAKAGAGYPLLSLLVFLRPDAFDGSLMIAYNDGQWNVVPAPLLEANESPPAVASPVRSLHFQSALS